MLVDYVRHEIPGIVTGWWRGVGATHNVFMVESFIDELAAAAKRDPIEYRRALLGALPPAAVIAPAPPWGGTKVAALAGDARPRPGDAEGRLG